MAGAVLGSVLGLAAGIFLGGGFPGLFSPYQHLRPPQAASPKPRPTLMALAPRALPGWATDDQGGALATLSRSCEKWRSLPAETPLGSEKFAMTYADWREVCETLPDPASGAARLFFERNFTALALLDGTTPETVKPEEGLFTGYFSPVYDGARRPDDTYATPLYTIPHDLQVIDLGAFDVRLAGHSIIGEVAAGRFRPYKSRRAIEEGGALRDSGLELVWLKSPIDAFFLHIQGSGTIRFPDGDMMRVGYAGRNGRPYQAVGRFLIEAGDIPPEHMSMQAIRRWMQENEDRAAALMWKNPSYIFFRELDGEGPVGSLGVPLTPGRSLAVDRTEIPLGVPLWLDLPGLDLPGLDLPAEDRPEATDQEPGNDHERKGKPLQRLMVAQDTGGAITGRVRGDVYWGIGPDAGKIAGPMKRTGRYYLLLPSALADRYLTGDAPPASAAGRKRGG